MLMPLVALSLAVSAIVGQNLGAKRIDRALKAGWLVAGIGAALMLALNTCLYVFAPQLATILSSDPRTIALTTSYLRITALCKPFIAADTILSGALQGAGDTRTPMWASLIANWVIRLPLAWFLAIAADWGADGVWWALTLSPAVLAGIVAWRFQSRKWVPYAG